MAVAKEKLIWMYRTMVLHREFDERVGKEFAAGNIPGFIHLSQGHEAIGAGAMAALRADDYITAHHRAHGHLLAKGGKPEEIMAELYGKATGCMKGKGGSQHMTNPDVGHIGSDALLGTSSLQAAGAALSAKLRGTDQVVVAFFGDGALNTGAVHGALNIAAAWQLPVVFICENNKWAESTSIYDSTHLTKLTDRAFGYGIPAVAVDGNDVLEVYEVVSKAVAKARKGGGPTFIEAKTCRQRAHYEGDTQSYRTKGEIDECRKRDPIPRFRKKLVEMGVLTEKEADKIHQEALKTIEKAVKFAAESPFPKPEEVLTDVLA